MSTATVEKLTPTLLWKYFAEICKIPRGSKNEAAITKYVVETGRRLGLEAEADDLGNVIVRKPATPGREGAPSIVLQGHLDMVCEKNKDKVHDFLTDPIELVLKDDVMMANGTTLGADNGVAVATNLALMEDRTVKHGPLEFLFTVDEETGLTGAAGLRTDFVKSKTLINLDSEEEGALYVGCSGGRNTTGVWKLETEPAPAGFKAGLVTIRGLVGGHSGLEIDKGRGNAVKIMGRVVAKLAAMGARVATMEGGNKHNAIPREAEALVYVPAAQWGDALKAVQSFGEVLRSEVATVDSGLKVGLEDVPSPKVDRVLVPALQKRLLAGISALPHGVVKMSADIPGLVETSTNVAVLETGADAITLVTSQRSSVASENAEICDTVAAIFDMAGAQVQAGDGYPGWKPNLDSPILKQAVESYQALYGNKPEVKAIHAGLECGIIGEKYPGMDMVSMGPTLEGVHSPDEKIYVKTVEKYWDLLVHILQNVK